MDFYEDELVRFNYDWKEVVAEYLFSGDEPVFNAVIADCQFFIHTYLSPGVYADLVLQWDIRSFISPMHLRWAVGR